MMGMNCTLSLKKLLMSTKMQGSMNVYLDVTKKLSQALPGKDITISRTQTSLAPSYPNYNNRRKRVNQYL